MAQGGTTASPGSRRSEDAIAVAEQLVALSRIDTVFADLYQARAAERLAPVFGEGAYRLALRDRAEAEALPAQLETAVAEEDWLAVRDTSARLAAARRRLGDSGRALAVAEQLNEPRGVLVDPLSLGLRGLSDPGGAGPEVLLGRALAALDRLLHLDPGSAALYRARHAALAAMLARAGDEPAVEGRTVRPGGLKAEALAALRNGDLDRLHALSSRALDAVVERAVTGGPGLAAAPGRAAPPPLVQAFPAEALERAGRLGLGPVHVPSAHDRAADLYPLAWQAQQGESAEGEPREEARVSLPVPFLPDAPPPLRELLTLFLRLPFVNSAGVRDLPSLVEEDALVELFDEPAPGAAPGSPLVEALGLPGRQGLSRVRVEQALGSRGVDVVAGLGLDPAAFRLVCIPFDLYVRVGRERGWGREPTWTHFDGHMVTKDRRFLALAGGDVRYGGIYDLVGVDRDYDAERLVARFAVVLRRRQEAW